jgi:hypothetical protein
MTDKITFQINFDYNMNVEIQSNSLSEELKETLSTMINERENFMDYTTLPELDYTIKSNSFGFEVDISTNDGKVLDIVEDHIKEQKELQKIQQYEQDMYFVDLNEQLNKELNTISL